MNGEKIRAAEEFVKGYQLCAKGRSALLGDVRVVGQQGHVPAAQAAGQRAADAPQADDADRAADHTPRRHRLEPRVVPPAHTGVQPGHVPQRAEHQRHGMVRHIRCAVSGRIAEHDAVGSRSVIVDRVVPGPGADDAATALEEWDSVPVQEGARRLDGHHVRISRHLQGFPVGLTLARLPGRARGREHVGLEAHRAEQGFVVIEQDDLVRQGAPTGHGFRCLHSMKSEPASAPL